MMEDISSLSEKFSQQQSRLEVVKVEKKERLLKLGIYYHHS